MASEGKLMRELGGLVLGQVRAALAARPKESLAQAAPEPPVVAQLMIEIRSDGSRTIARGALNDMRTGESAQVHAEGRTPSELMLSLAGSLVALPSSLFTAVVRKVEHKPAQEEALASDAPLPPEAHELPSDKPQ
jgi:hypothetical protein